MDESSLKLYAIMLFFIGLIGVMRSITALIDASDTSWQCGCGVWNDAEMARCIECRKERNR
jgi:hypothetical protein